ncbi:MAG TPA: 30S ribosomal protein S18 [Blastocatellia bacterium]|jgi:small subunit ribosomal protein S18|nr:30S ribosomal protein S18 [Blastocatellia bacterium]
MADNERNDRYDRFDRGDRGEGDRGRRSGGSRRRRTSRLTAEKIDYIDYKDVKLLQSFVPERGKITPRRISGLSAWQQRKLNEAIKRARNIALLPYTTH